MTRGARPATLTRVRRHMWNRESIPETGVLICLSCGFSIQLRPQERIRWEQTKQERALDVVRARVKREGDWEECSQDHLDDKNMIHYWEVVDKWHSQ